ncbi:hypothetical protein CMV_006574 [Castanea mollissima]|uniref:Uncharacterized protein n=1 Tax=Castanea mollissima TaxID=60419 RepID=A0A8J4VID6_9ROSI|nr:hypothetical protein CMV_024024 [Castanea mollissima]KAF3969653.1 hypothetical protein CMV_006574 [Castanea mollissima]
MALLDRMQRNGDNTKSPISPSLKLLQGSKWLPTSSSPTFGMDLDPEGICSSLQEMSSHQIEEGQEFETYSQR